MLVGECNPNANWGAIDAADLSIEIEFTLKTPAVGWEFTPAELTALTVGAAIPGAYGLRASNGLTADDFIDDADPGVLGFIIGGSLTGTPTAATLTMPADSTASAVINFNSTGFPIAAIGMTAPSWWDADAITTHSIIGNTITLDVGGWPAATTVYSIWIDDGSGDDPLPVFILTLVLT
jgi:hypothetical protein